jgi:hypothetical protein
MDQWDEEAMLRLQKADKLWQNSHGTRKTLTAEGRGILDELAALLRKVDTCAIVPGGIADTLRRANAGHLLPGNRLGWP